MVRETPAHETGRRLTGRMVLSILIGFFLVVSIANGVMIRAAVSTFSGVETGSAYQAGLTFERDVADARAQDALHWQVKASLQPSGDKTAISIEARDAGNQPLAGLEATVHLSHPTDRRDDRDVIMQPAGAGRFAGTDATPAGQWDLIIELSREGHRLFRSRNRVVLK
jgi:nitrogen fixation protein FixH